jgi:microsomal epoxide hydrolase
MPPLLSHGWPGSIVEFRKIVPMLTDPKRFGGDASDAFTVVAPSLPGYTLSFTPGQPRFGVVEVAEVFASLMTDVLGYSRFAAHGGDWGGQITSRLGYAFADRLIEIHVTLLVSREEPAPEEKIFIYELSHYLKEETGY